MSQKGEHEKIKAKSAELLIWTRFLWVPLWSTYGRKTYPAFRPAKEEGEGTRNCQQLCRGRHNRISEHSCAEITVNNYLKYSRAVGDQNERNGTTKWCNTEVSGWRSTAGYWAISGTQTPGPRSHSDIKCPSFFVFYFTIQICHGKMLRSCHSTSVKYVHIWFKREKRPLKNVLVQYQRGGTTQWARSTTQDTCF